MKAGAGQVDVDVGEWKDYRDGAPRELIRKIWEIRAMLEAKDFRGETPCSSVDGWEAERARCGGEGRGTSCLAACDGAQRGRTACANFPRLLRRFCFTGLAGAAEAIASLVKVSDAQSDRAAHAEQGSGPRTSWLQRRGALASAQFEALRAEVLAAAHAGADPSDILALLHDCVAPLVAQFQATLLPRMKELSLTLLGDRDLVVAEPDPFVLSDFVSAALSGSVEVRAEPSDALGPRRDCLGMARACWPCSVLQASCILIALAHAAADASPRLPPLGTARGPQGAQRQSLARASAIRHAHLAALLACHGDTGDIGAMGGVSGTISLTLAELVPAERGPLWRCAASQGTRFDALGCAWGGLGHPGAQREVCWDLVTHGIA